MIRNVLDRCLIKRPVSVSDMTRITGTFFGWFESYLTGRGFTVNVNDLSTGRPRLTCGLSPSLVPHFLTHMLELGDVSRRHKLPYLTCTFGFEMWLGENFKMSIKAKKQF